MKNAKHAMKNAKWQSPRLRGYSVNRFFIACFAFFILAAFFMLAAAHAQEWTLSTADFRTEQVALQSIDQQGVHVVAAGQSKPRVIAAEAFVQLDRGVMSLERPAKFMLHLITGDRVGGEPVKVENDRITWRNATVGELTIPLTQLAALTKPDQSVDLAAKRSEDSVQLVNGDAIRGIVVSISGDQAQIKPGGSDEPAAISLNNIVSIQFAATGAAPHPATGKSAVDRTYRVRLDDGSSLVGTSLTLMGEKLNLAIGSAEARPLPLASVVGIEQVNGPVSWLTSLRPSEDVQVPFVGTSGERGLWKSRIDADVAGQPLVIGGRAFKRGIGVHSYSRLLYPLDGRYKAFRTRYGINDSLTRADVTVRIRADDKLLHEAKNVRPGAVSPVVVVELGDAKQLVLEVDYGQGIDVEDRLNWIEPALLREKPTPAEAPAAATRPAAAPATAKTAQ
jgi:hypothetical protein